MDGLFGGGGGVSLAEERMLTDHIQVVRALEASLAAIAVVGRVFFILVLVKCCLRTEDVSAAVAGEPVLALFVCETFFPSMDGPSSKAPTAFDLVLVVGAVVEMVADAVISKAATTAFRHDDYTQR